MEYETKKDLAIFYWLKDIFSTRPQITVVDGYPTADLEIPCIAVDARTIDLLPNEIGNRHGISLRVWYIDIYAINKTQRNELAYELMRKLEDNIPVYDYDEGFPPDSSPTKINALIVEGIKVYIIKVLPELSGKLYYRAQISFEASDTLTIY